MLEPLAANREAFYQVVGLGFCSKKNDRHQGVFLPYFGSKCKAILAGHHYIENAQIEFAFFKSFIAGSAISA